MPEEHDAESEVRSKESRKYVISSLDDLVQVLKLTPLPSVIVALHAKLSGTVYCNRSCLCVCVCGGSVTTITRN